MAYANLFDQSIRQTIRLGIKALRDFPQSSKALARFFAQLPAAAKRRESWKEQGVVVPPLLIVSTTDACNLLCAGCYARANCRDERNEMTRTQIDRLLDEAVGVGCAFILLAGGEPLLSDKWLEAVASRPELLGLVFTNGTLLDDARADWFAEHRNTIPLFSVEGDAMQTDERRGFGVALRVENAMRLLLERSLPFGLSVTVGEHNIDDVASMAFLAPFIERGCRLTVFSEYVPVDDSTQLLALTESSKARLLRFCQESMRQERIVLVPFPGDESAFDGCLAAGRGFAHISASGALEPCPFAPYSDRCVTEQTLVEALASPLFEKIRNESGLYHEAVGGCALRGTLGNGKKAAVVL